MLIVALALAGCYESAPAGSQGPGATTVPTHLPKPRPTDTTVVDGSAIVGAILHRAALGFQGFTPGYNVQINTSGTRDGFTLFCDDRTDVQAAIRPMDGSESAACARGGVEFIRLTLGYDALAVVSDAPLGGCISASELVYVYTHDPVKLTWRDVRAALPSTPVKVFALPAETAAAQFFAERVIGSQRAAHVLDLQQLVTKGGGIGYLPLPEARKLNGRLSILSVDSGSGCTAPAEQTIWDGTYSLLSRPLYMYVNRESLRRSEVLRFVSYTLSVPGQQFIQDAGFIPASSGTYREAQAEIDRVER